MARSTPVPQSEVSIGKRLREIRESLLIAKTAFALQLGISRERLYNYEEGRSPLPWKVGYAVCNNFCVNPVWLAHNQGHPFLESFFSDISLSKKDQTNLLFSEGVNSLSKDTIAWVINADQPTPPYRNPESRHIYSKSFLDSVTNPILPFLKEIVSEWFKVIPPVHWSEFTQDLKKFGDKAALKYCARGARKNE